MGRVFVISDLHLSHKNMAIRRGFIDEIEHDEHIIKSWNSVVNKKDTVYVLGDITMEKISPYELLNRLNGIINVVGGNHDMKNHTKTMLEYVNSYAGMIDYKEFILTHCPVHPSQLEHRYSKNIHGHCVDESTEILTIEGWKDYKDLIKGEKIYSYNPIKEELEYDFVNNIIIHKNYFGKAYNLKGKGIDIFVTDKHRMCFINKTNKYEVLEANEYFKLKSSKIYKSFNFNRNLKIDLNDDLLKLYIYLVADGNITNKTLCRFNLKKDRKVILVEDLLKKLNIIYTKNQSRGFTRINFQMPFELYSWNIKGLDKKILDADYNQALIIKESYKNTDGNRNLIFTSKIEEVNLLQHMFIINGFSCKVHSRNNHGFSKNTSYQLSVTPNLTQLIPRINERVKEIENYQGLVWCIESNNKNFIARRNGSVFLTGNCHSNSLDDNRYINVCCEVVDYKPVLISEL